MGVLMKEVGLRLGDWIWRNRQGREDRQVAYMVFNDVFAMKLCPKIGSWLAIRKKFYIYS